MKKIYFLLLFLITKIATAQTNYQSGFYQADSLFFTVLWNSGDNQQLQWSVNRFTNHSWQPYTDGVWLKDRSQELNTWENIHYTGKPCYSYDESIPRGYLNRVNIVRVRTVDTVTNMIKRDSTYVIGFGEFPHNHYTLFCTIDSADVSEVFENYENKDIKKRAWLHIMKPDGSFEISQPVEFDIAAGSSACLPNKGVAFKATKDSPINGPNSFKTSLFTKNNKEEIKKIKFRVGGSGQNNSFGINEALLRVIDYPSWNIGGVRNTVGSWYLNGSYWSLGFPQVKPDERYVAEQYHIDKDSVDIISPIPFNVYFDTMYSGVQDGVSGIFVDFETETAQVLGLPEVYFYPNGQDFFQSTVIIRDTDGRKRVVAGIEEGKSIYVQPVFQELVKLIPDSTTDHFNKIDSLIDLDSWLRYICLINYFGLTDVISNNITIGSSYRHKPFILMEDFDWAGDVSDNWDTEIVSDNDQYDGIMHDIIRKIILKSEKCRHRMILIYQDMLNTGLLSNRVEPILDNIRTEIMPEYGFYHQSWGGWPNGGQDSLQQEFMFQSFTNYMVNYRPDQAAQILTNRWQPDDSLSISDRNWVNIIFDSIPAGVVTLNFNTLQLDSNFSGLYFPNPDVQINYTVQPGYHVNIKEYPDSGSVFSLSIDSNVTLTFILKNTDTIPVIPTDSNQKYLVISEILADNKNVITDENGEYEDYIEIYNPKDFPINLKGLYLSDKRDNLKKFQISRDTFISPNSYLLLWADEDQGQGIVHTNFKLSKDGESVYLSDGSIVYDSIVWTVTVPTDSSYGNCYYQKNIVQKYIMIPTPYNPNDCPDDTIISHTTTYNSIDFIVYPNPTKDLAQIKSDESIMMQVFNSMGVLVKTQELREGLNQFDLSNFPTGIYFLEGKSENKIYTGKLIKH